MYPYQPDHYESIRKDLHARWRRRLLLGANFMVFCMLIFGAIVFGLPVAAREAYLIIFGYMGVLPLHFLYVVFAELRDRAVRKALEKERRWMLLEQLVTKGEDQPTLAHLLLEEDDTLLEEFHRLQDEPKRKNH